MNFLKMYEVQRERQEKLIEALEREVQKLTSTNLELENANFALSKGQIPAQDSHYYKKDEIAMGQQIKELSDENFKL